MRKRIIAAVEAGTSAPAGEWLDLGRVAEVEITSEDPQHSIESALLPGLWRAAGGGVQTIRLLFAEPVRLRRIWLRFVDGASQRTQEFVLRWAPDRGSSFREIVRQQWNFSPQGATSETEDYRVDLSGVAVLELRINPDVSGGETPASLAALRLS